MLSLEYTILIGLGLVLILYFYVGMLYHRRFSRRIYGWLQRGLITLGDPHQAQSNRIGSNRNGGLIKLPHAHHPFQQVELLYVMQGGGLVLFWLINLWRGKQRDLLILRGIVRHPPTGELEVMPPDNQALQAIRQATENPWVLAEGPHNLIIAWRGCDARSVDRLHSFLQQYGASLKRLSWGPKEPHFLVALRLADLQNDEASPLFQAVRTAVGKLR